MSAGTLSNHLTDRSRLLRVSAARFAHDYLQDLGRRTRLTGVHAFVPSDQPEVADMRVRLAWIELGRADDDLAPVINNYRTQERLLLGVTLTHLMPPDRQRNLGDAELDRPGPWSKDCAALSVCATVTHRSTAIDRARPPRWTAARRRRRSRRVRAARQPSGRGRRRSRPRSRRRRRRPRPRRTARWSRGRRRRRPGARSRRRARFISSRARRILGRQRSRNFWPPKPGSTVMSSTMSSSVSRSS